MALFDYDNDRRSDVYLVQGSMLGNGHTAAADEAAWRSSVPQRSEVNADGTRRLHFTDVTADCRHPPTRGRYTGVAVGDIDNDGWPDLYLTGFGCNQMFRNNGNGTFTGCHEVPGTDDHRRGACRQPF